MCLAPRYRNGPMAAPSIDCTNRASRFDTPCAQAGLAVAKLHRISVTARMRRRADDIGALYRPSLEGQMRTRAIVLGVLAAALVSCSSPSAPPPAEPAARADPPAPTAGRLFVTNETGGDISVVDVALQKVVATIPVGKRPRGIRLSADGATLFVALSGSPIAPPGVDESTLPPADKKADGIGVVSVADLKLLRVLPGGSDPEQMALSADGRQLFVANEDAGQVTAISVDDGKVLATFAVGGEPEGVELRPDGRAVYVTSEEDSHVAVIDVPSMKLLTTVKVGPRPRSTGFLPDSSRAYVSSENGGSVAVLDAKTHKVLQTIQLSGGELTRPM